MKKISILLVLTCVVFSCKQQIVPQEQDSHLEPTHNFTVNRLIILNDNNEMLMGKDEGNWYPIAETYDKPQFVMEGLNNLSKEVGIKTTAPKLHGYFSYKYEYHPFSTLRAFYVAKYVSGTIRPSGNWDEMRWMPIDEAIAKTPVESIKMVTKQIVDFPDTLWGGSFVAFRKGEHHHTRMVEDFYPLFN